MLNVNIQGKGEVSGSTLIVGSEATLSATPADGYSFKGWIVDGMLVVDNPFVFQVETLPITALFYVSVASYLRGLVGFEVDDNVLRSIHIKRGVDPDSDVASVEPSKLELAEADIYVWRASVASSVIGEENSDNGWKHKAGGWEMSVSDKRHYMSMANNLYRKNGEALRGSILRIFNL